MAKTGYRTFHSAETIGDDLYLWGGDNGDSRLAVHDNVKKRSITNSVEVLSLSPLSWTKTTTTGTPPEGMMDYGTAVIGKNMLVFGGRCGDLCHNELYALNTDNKVWRNIPCTDGPMEKSSCGFISYFYQGSRYLLTLGGIAAAGEQPANMNQPSSLYIPIGSGYYTNEIHSMDVTHSLGEWKVPIVKGSRPVPIANFSFDALSISDGLKAIMFGGKIAVEKYKSHPSADLYFLSLVSSDTVEFWKLSPQSLSGLKWPGPRYRHASTVIKSYYSTGKEESHLLVMGGLGATRKTIADCWIMNVSTRKWSQIHLPQLVCGRFCHSLSSITIKRNCEWLIITGGRGSIYSNISGTDITVIVEIEYVSGQWVVFGVWNSTQKEELTERMKKLRSERTGRDEEEVAHLQQEIERLTKQLRNSQEETRQVRRELTEQVEQLTMRTDDLGKQICQKDATIKQNEVAIHQLTENVHQKDEQIQRLQVDLTAKADQVQALQNDLSEMDRIVDRKELTITKQQQEIRRYSDNPPWLIEREEVVMTEEVLGIGGWGEVKVGIFRGTRVAVKCLHRLIVSEYYLQLFSREMDIASRVRHPNLLQFIGATRVGNPIIVTELMPTSLRKELEKCPMTKPQVITIGTDVTAALNYLHMWKPQPILHRDVSSANVLLEPSVQSKWKAKLSDYGSANLLENVCTAGPGSPVYSAPEATTPKLHSPAMDIYSVGILLVEMATGHFPSSVSYEREVQIQEVKWPIMKKLVLRCTHDDPKSRPTTEKLLEDLKAT